MIDNPLKWMNVKIIMLSERGFPQKATYCMSS